MSAPQDTAVILDTATLCCGDCLDLLPLFPEMADACVTDPPYGLSDEREDGGKVFVSTLFDVVLPDHIKAVSSRTNQRELPGPCSRGSMLRFMDRTIWEEARIAVPERAVDFYHRTVFWDEEIKDSTVAASRVPHAVLIEKLNSASFEEGPHFFLNPRPTRDATFRDGSACSMAELGNGSLRVPIVIPLDSCLAGFIGACTPRDPGFFADLVRMCNDPSTKASGSAIVMTSAGAELRAVLRLDLTNGTVNLLPAIGSDPGDFVFELRCPKPIGARPRAGCLPSGFKAINLRLIGDATNRTVSLCLHSAIISQANKKSSGFMGKGWDHGVPGPEYWQAVLNACKPGAHLLAFGGTRTFHRLACAIEDAGWEMRDTLMWVYGSGFPKSHNLQGEYNGLGTALKPAWEPILLARKPLIGTVAANVQAHGTGALNIDACRIPTDPTQDDPRLGGKGDWSSANKTKNVWGGYAGVRVGSSPLGRWPANLLHDGSPEVLACFPAQAGAAAPVKGTEPSDQHKSCYHDRARVPGTFFNDSGSAARFFYCPKASQQDRDEGCEAIPATQSGMSNGAQLHGPGYSKGQDIGLNRVISRRNHHPTVKPTPLMRYLCRLVTPPGGTVLDPFMGSGSTGKAATLEGLHFLGFDSDKSYLPISVARISHAIDSYKASAIQQSLSNLL